MKSPVRENRPLGSVRGAPGNWRPYLDTSGDGGHDPYNLKKKTYRTLPTGRWQSQCACLNVRVVNDDYSFLWRVGILKAYKSREPVRQSIFTRVFEDQTRAASRVEPVRENAETLVRSEKTCVSERESPSSLEASFGP